MKIHTDIHSFHAIKPVLAIGNFDGIHMGHRAIIERIKKIAHEIEGESVLMTLWPHPRVVLNQHHEELRFLTLLDEKIELIRKTGIDHLVILPFTKELAEVTYDEFISHYILKKIKTRYVLVGYNHHFGKNREGNFNSLKKLADELGFVAEQFPMQQVDNQNVSSSEIRQLLLLGKIKLANELLGYTYFFSGDVMEGKKIGREIGFPTANIKLVDSMKLIPADGVYAVKVQVQEKYFSGMMNIGTKPTINNDIKDKTIEVHLFDFSGDLYEKRLKINFIERIREERRFNSLEDLKAQLKIDKAIALKMV